MRRPRPGLDHPPRHHEGGEDQPDHGVGVARERALDRHGAEEGQGHHPQQHHEAARRGLGDEAGDGGGEDGEDAPGRGLDSGRRAGRRMTRKTPMTAAQRIEALGSSRARLPTVGAMTTSREPAGEGRRPRASRRARRDRASLSRAGAGGTLFAPGWSQRLSHPLPSHTRSPPPPAAFTEAVGFRPLSARVLPWIQLPSGVGPTSKVAPLGKACFRLTTAIPKESLPRISLPATSVRSAPMMKMPVPAGTWDTMAVGSPKFAVVVLDHPVAHHLGVGPHLRGVVGQQEDQDAARVVVGVVVLDQGVHRVLDLDAGDVASWTSLPFTTMSRDCPT